MNGDKKEKIKTVRIEDVSFLQKGKGKDLVLFHGYLSSKEAFAAQLEYFSRFYRVTAFDFLGQGKSAELSSPFSVEDYAAWTEEILGALGVRSPCVIAHSFGCRVAIKMLARGKLPFGKVVLTGPAGVVMNRGSRYRRRVRLYRFVRRFAPEFADKHFGSAEYRSLSPMMRESYKKIVNEDLRADAARVENSVLIVQGERDTVTPACEAHAYRSVMKNARLVTLDGGHFAFAENPVAFNILVEEFLQDDR